MSDEPLQHFLITLSRDELRIVNQALNEVVNGIQIDDWDFPIRLSASREKARELLHRIHNIFEGRNA